jgi:hypothetical protein
MGFGSRIHLGKKGFFPLYSLIAGGSMLVTETDFPIVLFKSHPI